MAIRIQLRKDAASVWDSADSVLKAGEFGFAWDSADSASFGRLKIGDGSTSWTNLPYFYSAGDSAGNYASAGGAAAWYGDRGLNLGGRSSGNSVDNIDYFDITTPGNASDFGDLTVARRFPAAFSDATYGLEGGGVGYLASIDYVTIATPGNASDFGDLTLGRYGPSGCSDATTGIVGGGFGPSASPWYLNTIDYVTIASPGNATDFGDLPGGKRYAGSSSNSTYGLFGGGYDTNDVNGYTNIIDYVTIASPGNATDFGDLTVKRQRLANGTVSDETYGLFSAGTDNGSIYYNIIDYVTIASPGNATDFGDLINSLEWSSSTGNGSRGVNMGGLPSNGVYSNVIQYYTIASPGNATDFGDLTISADAASGTSGSPS